MKILLLGKNGQVGWELQRSLSPLGELVAIDRHSSHYCGDLANTAGLIATIQAIKPDVIVNAAAYTAVDNAETDQATVHLINAAATRAMAEEAAKLGAWLVHYSTDYVFEGNGELPWRESSATSPVNAYGKSKLDGEEAIAASHCKHLIFRTSWVYAARGKNFAKTMLHLAKERETLSVIADQFGAPTGAELLADVTALAITKAILDESVSGLYHLAASGEVSWHGYAEFVIDFAKSLGESLAVKSVMPTPTSAYPTPAKRPLNSRLNTEKLQSTFSVTLPRWEAGVARMLTEIISK